MAYGDDRVSQATDGFSSIGSNWTNGPDLWNGCTASSGTLRPDTAAQSCRIVRNDDLCDDDQYSQVTISSYETEESTCGVTTRGTSSTTACYMMYCLGAIGASKYRILDVDENGGSSLVDENTAFGGSLSSGDELTGESEGSTHRFGTKEGAGSDTEYCNDTDTTWTGGEVGVYVNHPTTVANTQIDSWDGGDISAAVNVTRTPSEYDLSLTGKIPSVEIDYYVDISKRALALSGKIPSVEFDYYVDVNKDALALSGKVPGVSYERYSTPAIDSLALGGQALTVAQTWSAAPSEYDLTLTGTISLVARGVARVPDVDALALAGQVPVIRQTWSAAPTEDSLALAGKTPVALLNTQKAPAIYALALSGKISSVEFDYYVDVSGDALNLAGKAPSIEFDYYVDVGKDALALAGKIPQTLENYIITPPAYALTLVGKTPSAEKNYFIDVAVDALTFTEQTPLLFTGRLFTIDADPVVLAGKTATVAQTWSAAPSEDTLALTGQTPLVATGSTVSVPRLEMYLVMFTGLELFGYPPIVYEGAKPDTGSLSLASTAPTITYASAANISVSIDEGTFTLTGKIPLRVERISPVIPIDEYALTITGLELVDATGILIEGHAPNVAESLPTINPGTLSFSFGTPIIIDTSTPPVEVGAPRQRMELTGYALAFEDSQTTVASSFTLQSWIPKAEASSPTYFPAAGALAFTTYVPPTERETGPTPDALALTGQTPTLLQSNNYFPDPITYDLILDGKAPSVNSEYARELILDEGALSLSGQQVYLGRSITPAACNLILGGKIPLAGDYINPVEFPAADTLALAGKTPISNIGPGTIVQPANLVLAGQIPIAELTFNSLCRPAAYEVNLTGYIAAVNETGVKTPAAGTLTLVGTIDTVLATKNIRKQGGDLRCISLTPKRSIKVLYS